MHLSILEDVLPCNPKTEVYDVLNKGNQKLGTAHREISLKRDNSYKPIIDLRDEEKQEKDSFLIVSA